MAAIKEKDLPVKGNVARADYFRIVTSVGESKRISAAPVYDVINADYIVEEGTSGFWEYRKWNSGIAECWGSTTETKGFVSWGSVYNCDLSEESFPPGFFIDVPICLSTFINGGATAVGGPRGLPTKDSTVQGAAIRGTSAGGTYTWTKAYYAIGKWK